MVRNAQRRSYRLSVAGATCFLVGVFLSQTGDMDVASFQLYLACTLVVVGIILCLKAFGMIMYSEDNVEYTYEDDIEEWDMQEEHLR